MNMTRLGTRFSRLFWRPFLTTSLATLMSFGVTAALAVGFTVGCSTEPEKGKVDEAEVAYNAAAQFEKEERYEEAIRRFNDVKNKFPYSRFAVLAELAVADTYYKQESYPEAQVAYQNFKDLHPKHAKIDYVTYRLGLCYFLQLPSSADRDLSLAANALVNFDEVMRLYPTTENLKDLTEKRLATLKMLAEKEVYIADFYFKKQQWLSAMNRYENGARKYPGQGFDAKSLSRAAICAKRLSNTEKARTLLQELKEKFPAAPETLAAEKEIQ